MLVAGRRDRNREDRFLDAHGDELPDKYPESWVAVYEERVVGVAPYAQQLLDNLRPDGIRLCWAVVDHLTRQEEIWILSS